MMLRPTCLSAIILCLLTAACITKAQANSPAPEALLTKESVTEFYARSSLIYHKPYEEYLQYLDDIFTADSLYTDLTEYSIPNRKMPPPTTAVYDKAKILDLAKPVYDSMRQGALSNHVKGIYISEDGKSANVVVRMQVDGIHSPNSDLYLTSLGTCQDNLVAGGKYGIMVKSTKCTMTTRQMKNAPPTQKFGAPDELLKSVPIPAPNTQ